MFISIFLFVIFWHSKLWPIATWGSRITSFSFRWRIQSEASLRSAKISKLMIANRNSPSQAIKSVITALQMDDDRRGVRKIGSQLGNNTTPNTHIFKKIKKIRNKK